MTGFAFFVVTFGVIHAAICDIRTLRIPNWLHLVMVGILPVAILIDSGFRQEIAHEYLLRCVMAIGLLVVGFVMFARGWLGGGDAKLLAWLGLWVPIDHFVAWLLFITLYGGAIGAVLLIMARMPLPAWLEGAGIGKGIRLGQPRMPYALPIALATITVLIIIRQEGM